MSWMSLIGPFTRVRANVYLACLALWAGGWVSVVMRQGDRSHVTNASGGLLLVVLFVGCWTIAGLAFLMARDQAAPVAMPDGARSFSPGQFLVLVTVLFWALIFGLGIPAAIKATRG